MTWTKSFRDMYLERFGCESKNFEEHMLRLALPRSRRPLGWVVSRLSPGFFGAELRTLRYLGNSRSPEEFRAELTLHQSTPRLQPQ